MSGDDLKRLGFRKILGKDDYLLGKQRILRINFERTPVLIEFCNKEIKTDIVSALKEFTPKII